MRGSGRPQRRLRFKRANDRAVVEDIDSPIERAKCSLMRQQLRERDLFFAGLRKLPPELAHPLVDVDLVLFQDLQHTRPADSFRSRPNYNYGIRVPRILATRVAQPSPNIFISF